MSAADGERSGPWLNASVVGFGVASLLSDLGHEAATAALPALLATFGAAPAILGIIEGVSDGIVAFAKLGGGHVANRWHWRKPICVGGYLVTGLSTGLFALVASWPQLLVARSIGWLARGFRGPSRDAMLADSVPESGVGRAFGFHRAMDTIGAVLGPLVASVLVAAVSLDSVFVFSLVPGVLSAVALFVLVRRQRTTTYTPKSFTKSLAALPPSFRRFLGAVFAFGMGDFARTLLILRATELMTPELGVGAGAAFAMGLFAWHNVVAALAAFPIGRLADRTEPRTLLQWGYALGAVTALFAAFVPASIGALVGLFAIAGLTIAFEDTLESTVTARLVPKELRGSGYGALAATNGVGDLVSSALVGILWTLRGPEVAFACAAVACAVGAWLVRER
ncbi:MAG: MFS transporter [Deltaproteobacteria bacterium]|nr:MFS transporter [Deltaproteobacteria bacterium]